MTPFVEPIDHEHLAAGGVCDRALAWFAETGGVFGRNREGTAELLRDCHVSAVLHDGMAPVLMAVGLRSPAARTFGLAWAETAAGRVGVPDEDAERLFNRAYYVVDQSDSPAFHLCRGDFLNDDGISHHLFYTRVLLPVVVTSTRRGVLCAADLVQLDS